MLTPGDVIWLYAGTIRDQKEKMHACVSVSEGYFFRINTKGHWSCSFPVKKNPGNGFLDHDSFLECGALIEIDEYDIEQSLDEGRGRAGRLSDQTITELIEYIRALRTLTTRQKNEIIQALESVLG